jgi:hypothetical protein
MAVANTQAYFHTVTITAKEIFIEQVPGMPFQVL